MDKDTAIFCAEHFLKGAAGIDYDFNANNTTIQIEEGYVTVMKRVCAPTETKNVYTYEELFEMPAEELLDVFIRNGLVISDELEASFTEEEIQKLFKEQFGLWHIGVSSMSHTMYMDLAEQTKVIYDKITDSKK